MDKIWLSPSSIGTFLDCRQKYFLKHLKRIIPKEEPKYLAIGKAVHWVLSCLFSNKLNLFAEKVEDINGLDIQRVINEIKSEEDRIATVCMLESYVSWASGTIVDDVRNGEFEPLSVEMPFIKDSRNVGIKWIRGVGLTGRIDLVLQHAKDQSVAVIDHKTSSSSIDNDCDSRLWMDPQMMVYCLVASDIYEKPVRFAMHNVLQRPRIKMSQGETEEEFQRRKETLERKNKSGKSSAKRQTPETAEEFERRVYDWYEKGSRFACIEKEYTEKEVEDFRFWLRGIMQEVLQSHRKNTFCANPSACNRTGQGKCEYFDLCMCDCNMEDEIMQSLYTQKNTRE